ncbi:MAG: FxsA family protein [Actinomycetota bacterium]|nr:FxsA family protein [Actinomycetota bacterium]MDA2971409.1 FxsA family protein [Actinomycetota bacterium]MDA3002077.1 FxsA family protein [Actinomycetota bacterium]
MILFLLFIVFPVAELYVIIRVGSSIGFLNTLGLIVLIAVVGSWLVKREGIRVWTKFNRSVLEGRVPTQEIVDGVLIMMAGALLLAPGFVTDVLAILVLFPPTRMVFRGMLLRRARAGTTILGGFGTASRPPGARPGDVIDTDGTEPHGEI